MLIALFADIHANQPAFSACLAKAREQGAQRFVLLGDYVGYGADPDWAVTTVTDLVAQGAVAILGNHDSAVGNPRVQMNAEAQAAIEWTRGKLGPAQRQFLAQLPVRVEEDRLLFVHSEASKPDSWIYVTDTSDASRSMMATSAHVTFCGHVHKPALYSLSVTGKMTTFVPTSHIPVHLLPGRQWLVVLGAVGQPRDGNPAAAYALFDTEKREITYCRAAYDVEEAARRIRKNGLPIWLAERLLVGK
ncbi:MAG: metallophosphoesterase family protein [Rhodopseudomonas sp.]|uniref:metallophosphoesterase family protein n=1 Tax=Rhodopseudomonas sp. TaxID=1078 RepID=UPI001853D4B2|nr:metallophosphoesterase family protein [Rhodopseudomonas sp.]NVN88860.1 metallophosphoesterase family protein [Rhodopseudomonas sp.]